MQGSLSSTNVSDLVAQIFVSKRSGILRLTQSDVKKSVYFKEGSIVFAHSNLKNERLGEVLLRLGKITEEEFDAVSEDLKGGKRLGQALYERGYLSPPEVNAGVGYQIQQIVYSLCNWDHGDWEFVDRERPVYEDIMVDVSTPTLLIDGIRNITNLFVLERAIARKENELVTLNPGTKTLPRSNLDFSEETILACIDGKTSISQLRTVSRLTAFEFGRAIYCLTLSGMIELGGQQKITESRNDVQKPASATPLHTRPMPASDESGSSVRMKTLSEPELRAMILETDKKYRHCTDEEVLNVLPGSTNEEIQGAYDRLTATFHPPYYSTGRYGEVKDPLKRIIDRLADSYHNLMDKFKTQRPFLEAASQLPEKPLVTPSDPIRAGAPSPKAEAAEPKPAETTNELEGEPIFRAATLTEIQAQLSRDPSNVTLMRELGKKLQQAGKAKEGEKLLLRAVELEPRNIENHFAIAEFYQAQGLKFKAFTHLNIILQIAPQNQRAMDLLGIKKRKGGLYEIGTKI